MSSMLKSWFVLSAVFLNVLVGHVVVNAEHCSGGKQAMGCSSHRLLGCSTSVNIQECFRSQDDCEKEICLKEQFECLTKCLWMNQSELEISKEQLTQLKSIKMETSKKLIAKKADVDLNEVDLKGEVFSNEWNEEKMAELINKKFDLLKEQAVIVLNAITSIRQVLTDEQKQKLVELKQCSTMKKTDGMCPLKKNQSASTVSQKNEEMKEEKTEEEKNESMAAVDQVSTTQDIKSNDQKSDQMQPSLKTEGQGHSSAATENKNVPLKDMIKDLDSEEDMDSMKEKYRSKAKEAGPEAFDKPVETKDQAEAEHGNEE